MNSIIVTDKNRGCYGQLLDQQFRQRRNLFVGQFGWEIPHTTTLEADQYDRVDTVYILVEKDGLLVGYARLLKTSKRAKFGQTEFSFMVRDAQLGLLPGIPTDIIKCTDVPSDPSVWEMTRVQAADRHSLAAIFRAAASYLTGQGARETITFTRKSFASILTALGYPTIQIGPSYVYGGKHFCVLRTDIMNEETHSDR